MKYAVFNRQFKVAQKYIIVLCTFLSVSLFTFACEFGTRNMTPKALVENPSTDLAIYPGANQFDVYIPLIKDKTVAVVGNQTSVVFKNSEHTKHVHLVDHLIEAGVKVVKVFSPEHGFRGDGDAGEIIRSDIDKKTGLPIVSLYGNNKKPKPEQLKGIDVVIFDLQDVGVRFYTYISTLHYVMEACAEANIPIIVLDRPNPNIDIVDGPVLEFAQKSFIGMHQVPVLYGMSIGEYAQMINGEKWIKKAADLTVVPCSNYTRESRYSLPIAPSPNLRTDNAIAWYASLCLFEGTVFSVGRGTDKPFEQVGHPDFPKKLHSFTPKPGFGSKDPLLNGQLCFGYNYSDSIAPRRLNLNPIISMYAAFTNKEGFFLKNNFFNLLIGNSDTRRQIEIGQSEEMIRKGWQAGIEEFLVIRTKYLIYK
jgi:uncharacterized protein YbbC (DUF1343 family)